MKTRNSMTREMQRRTKRIQRSHLCWIGDADVVAGRGVVIVVTAAAALVSCVPVAYS